MFKLTFCLHRLPNTTRAEFQKYWREVHGPMVAGNKEALGVRRYIQTHTLAEGSVPAVDNIKGVPDQYDGVAELWYDSREAYEATMTTPEGKTAGRALYEDGLKFIDMARSPVFGGEELDFVRD